MFTQFFYNLAIAVIITFNDLSLFNLSYFSY